MSRFRGNCARPMFHGLLSAMPTLRETKPLSDRDSHRLWLSRSLRRRDEGRHRVDRAQSQRHRHHSRHPRTVIVAGAIALRESWRFFPQRTVFLAVVDPGVGTARAPIAIETRAGARFVGPDNGLLWLAAKEAGIKRIVELTSPRHRLTNVSATFHGRDIFAPAAAYLWRGTPISALGPRCAGTRHRNQLKRSTCRVRRVGARGAR